MPAPEHCTPRTPDPLPPAHRVQQLADLYTKLERNNENENVIERSQRYERLLEQIEEREAEMVENRQPHE